MKVSPTILRLVSGSVTPARLARKRSAASTWMRLSAEAALEGLDDALGLVFAEEAVVDEDAGELVADGFVDERRGDGGVDAAGEGADDAAVADLGADAGDGVGDEVAGGPVGREAADAEEEVLEEGLAVGRVDDFGVELDAEVAGVVAEAGDGRVSRLEARMRKPGGGSVMRSPWDIQTGMSRAEAGEQRLSGFRFEVSAGVVMWMTAWPNSLRSEGSTRPPSW